MKTAILNLEGKEVKQIELPKQFNEPVREDLIKRAVQVIQSHKKQSYGAKEGAGMRYSSDISKRRRKYRGCYGHGGSRTPRKVLSRNGEQFNWEGATAPNTKGGRRAHPPKSEKKIELKINEKERKKAIRSAIAATAILDIVKKRGHQIEKLNMIIENGLEDINKTKDAKKLLESLQLTKELERVKEKKVRAGKGKLRGRKYTKKKGPLLVVSKKCNLIKSAKNIAGIEIATVESLNAELLAPGTKPGRLTIWSEAAIQRLDKEKLFTHKIGGSSE